MIPLSLFVSSLCEATDGLLVSSETDAPLQLFVWPVVLPFNLPGLLAVQGLPETTPIAEVALATFFAPRSRIHDGQTAAEQTQALRFQQLQHLLEANLTELRVIRIGEIEITVWIVGKTSEERLVGLTTLVVET